MDAKNITDTYENELESLVVLDEPLYYMALNTAKNRCLGNIHESVCL
jgi:hypothetical protein